MNIQLPELDGYQATARIHAWEGEQRRAPKPIVTLTADAMAGDMEGVREALHRLEACLDELEPMCSLTEASERRS
jgi:CheY-like chemotaxis protein